MKFNFNGKRNNVIENNFFTFENQFILNEIEKNISDEQITYLNKDNDVVSSILITMDKLEDNNILVTDTFVSRYMVCSPSFFRLVRATEHFDPVYFENVLESGVYGHIATLDILVSGHCQKNVAYILPQEAHLGKYDTDSENDAEYITITKNESNYLVEEDFKYKLYNGHVIQKIVYNP